MCAPFTDRSECRCAGDPYGGSGIHAGLFLYLTAGLFLSLLFLGMFLAVSVVSHEKHNPPRLSR